MSKVTRALAWADLDYEQIAQHYPRALEYCDAGRFDFSVKTALSEARRATFDPTYGRYTWGKLEIMDLREQARKHWGNGFTLLRFHTALMDLGSPPLGLLGTALDRG